MTFYATGRNPERCAAGGERAFVVLNPEVGPLCDAVPRRGGCCRRDTCRSSGSPTGSTSRGKEDLLLERVREAVESGCDLVVAAGGDGTVSSVADALAGTETPLAIVPLGTANVLAGELGIPLDLDAACALLAGDHALTRIDAMAIDGKHYVTQVGVGLDAEMIRDTAGEHKRRFGRAAYLWTAAVGLVGLRRRRFTLTVDGVTSRHSALQVLEAKVSGTLGSRPFRWGPDIRPDDGRLDVCVIRARTVVDFLGILGWQFVTGRHRRHPKVSYLPARPLGHHRHDPADARPGRRRDRHRDPRHRQPRARLDPRGQGVPALPAGKRPSGGVAAVDGCTSTVCHSYSRRSFALQPTQSPVP